MAEEGMDVTKETALVEVSAGGQDVVEYENEGEGEEDQDHHQHEKAAPNQRQTIFAWGLMDVCLYVTVINLFVEYVPQMTIQDYSFTISLFTAVVLKLVLEGVHFLQHTFKNLFCGTHKPWWSKPLGAFFIWLVLFGSKFLILWIDETIFHKWVDLGGVKLIMLLSIVLMIAEKVLRIGWAQLGQPERWLTWREVLEAAMH
ncbi:expressed unknown protein [Seminavis robusta]|uniref:Uncharacterized protein n=1 Tax=Seminavis robusta TaxID=568900 RepID=A0A9N8EMD5_9STRA|nr:expressed unknown protein [Seminavis robusta]|eukprot:Sro1456_g274220.1 n/a (201) ;mRNA; r:9492-10094